MNKIENIIKYLITETLDHLVEDTISEYGNGEISDLLGDFLDDVVEDSIQEIVWAVRNESFNRIKAMDWKGEVQKRMRKLEERGDRDGITI